MTAELESRILIMGAMTEEIDKLLSVITHEREERWNGFLLHFGKLDGRAVIVCKSGIGKVFAALITQHLIDRYRISHTLFTGVAGAVADALEPGDIVLGVNLLQHDMNASALGFERGHIPFTDYRHFPGDPALLEAARDCVLPDVRIQPGCIGTGDQFITDKSGLRELEIDCVDMEGCAVAQVCAVNAVPCLIIRVISDKADGSAKIDFAANLPRFASRSLELIRFILARI